MDLYQEIFHVHETNFYFFKFSFPMFFLLSYMFVVYFQQVEMIVDHCERATLEPGGTVSDDKMCRATGTTPGENVYLNVNTLLQLGGRYSTPNKPTGIMPTKFNGCVKNLMHNSRVSCQMLRKVFHNIYCI